MKYEYRVEIITDYGSHIYENAINKQSKEGFELFKVNPVNNAIYSGGHILIFRRETKGVCEHCAHYPKIDRGEPPCAACRNRSNWIRKEGE